LNRPRKGEDINDLFGDFESGPEGFIFFLGAGFSSGIGLPSGRELAESLAKRYGEEVQGLDDVISSLLGKGVNREEICKAIKDEFNNKESTIKESMLLGLFNMVIGHVTEELDRRNSSGWVSIATTNWDETLTSFLGKKVEVIYPGKVLRATGKRVIAYHLHGSIKDCGSLILTKEEKKALRDDGENGPFQNLTDKFNVLMDRLKADVNERRVIFIGYSMADDDILSIYINSRKRVASSGEDYIIVKDEESKGRIEGILAGKGLKEAAKVVVMDSLEFLEELARYMHLVLDDHEVELETERSMKKILGTKRSLIVVGPPLSGLTTLYNNHLKEFPPDKKLSFEYTYDEGERREFNELINRLLKGEHIALVGPEYTFNYYLDKSGLGDKERKRIEEITVRHRVKEKEAKEYLNGLIEGLTYKDKFDEELKKKILDLVKLDDGYPLRLLREVFRDVEVRIARGDNIEAIKHDLDEKENRRGEVEGVLGVSSFVALAFRNWVGFAAFLPVSPYLLAVLLAGGGLYEFIKHLKGNEGRPLNKIFGLKKYWDSLNESERRMLCYKLDEKNGLRPGDSEAYLKRVFGDELEDLEGRIRELEYHLRDLNGIRKKLDELEREYGNILNELAELREDFRNFRDQVKSLSDELRSLIEEHEMLKSKFESWSVGAPLFFIEDVEKGLLYSSFLVEVGVPKIKINTPKDIIRLVNSGRFQDVARDVLSKLKSEGRVALVGPKGVGKSTLATYAAWRALLGGLDDIDTHVNALIRVDKLEPGAASSIENVLNEATGRSFLLIYDPSPIEAYLEPATMQRGHSLKEIEFTLKELKKLMGVKGARVMVVLPSELYDLVKTDSKEDEELKRALEGVGGSKVDVDLRDEDFLRGIIGGYSGCHSVPEELVQIVKQGFSGGYTLVAKYAGVWLRERKCEAKDISEALKVSEPKIFFAHYIWDVMLGRSMNLAKKVSVPLMLHATYGPIPEGITYITKATNVGGIWRLLDKDSLKDIQLTDLREEDLEPIAKLLSIEHEDLVEETLKELAGLRGEKEKYIKNGLNWLVEALGWGYDRVQSELEAFEEMKREEAEDNLTFFTGERLNLALEPLSNNCWKRAALIIGHGLGRSVSIPLPKAEDLPKDVAESLNGALNECGIDDYLLVGNEIPPLIRRLILKDNAGVLVDSFVDKYNETISEINKVLNNARNRGSISNVEAFYGLGLVSIIVRAAVLGNNIEPGYADAALYIASFAIQDVASASSVKPILGTLEPLHDYVFHRYLELLFSASDIRYLDRDTAKYVFEELNNRLDKHGGEVEKHVWSLVHAIATYAELLGTYPGYFSEEEIEGVVGKVVDLLNELGDIKSHLRIIAWAFALIPALRHENMRKRMEGYLHIDVVKRAEEVCRELDKLKERIEKGEVRELLNDKDFMSYIESRFIKANNEAVMEAILRASSFLKHVLAMYRLSNDELGDETARLFSEAAEEWREVDDYGSYLATRGWVLRVGAVKNPLTSNEMVDSFRQLYEEAFKKENFKLTATYLTFASARLGNYLVSLALINNIDGVNELFNKHWAILNINKVVSVLTRLMLNVLLTPKGRLSGELKGRLIVQPAELIRTFKDEIRREFLPALEDGYKECESIDDSTKRRNCRDTVLAVMGDGNAIEWLRGKLTNDFQKEILEKEKLDLFKRLGVDVDELVEEFRGLVGRLDSKSLVQLIAPGDPMSRLALMLYALINGDEKLAKAHVLFGAVAHPYKLGTRLFLEAYKACCDLGNEGFGHAIAKLFFLHL